MWVKKLYLKNLRNHFETILEPANDVNFICGENGSGKTTILEAISIAGLSKSFLPCSESHLIRNEEEEYSLKVDSKSDNSAPYWIVVNYKNRKKKEIRNIFSDNLLPKDIIGNLPVVVLSPDYKSITFGSPDDRRQFIDRLLSQSSKIYFEYLLNYRKALRQRNALLSEIRSGSNYSQGSLTNWTEMLIKAGAELIARRFRFVADFIEDFKYFYEKISSSKEEVDLKYQSYSINSEIDISDTKIIEFELYRIHEKLADNEIRRGTTLFGPQKDDLSIMINSGLAKDYASQGQHKSLLISLKFAEFEFLKKIKSETPIFLLDDIFSELDRHRSGKVFELLRLNKAQSFITLTELDLVNHVIKDFPGAKIIEVKNGRVNHSNYLVN